MNKLLKEISRLYRVEERDMPKTLERFKREIEEMEKALGSEV